MPLDIVILAAGQGTRMKSDLPKVLQPIAGKPMLEHVLDRSSSLGATCTHVVYGHGGRMVPDTISKHEVSWVEQAEQLGTGHAVEQAMPDIDDDSIVLVLYGDVPLICSGTLQSLIETASKDSLAVLSIVLADPAGYGRIVRDESGRAIRIVEQKDASDDEKSIREGNTGILACRASRLRGWLGRLGNDNSQGEYYLTDVIAMAVGDGYPVEVRIAASEAEVTGVNDKRQLAQLEAENRAERADALMLAGVTLLDPKRIDVRGTLRCGRDVTIDVNAVFEGEVELGDNVTIGPNVLIRNATLGAGCNVHANSVIDDATIGAACDIGPFARVRPGTVLDDTAKLGNFVEVKKSRIGKGSKVNHLTYIGDSEIGQRVNVGAGTITCNYDGVNKFKTTIEDDAFIGSGVELVAPVTVGHGATIGAGSTISNHAEPDTLTVARARQTTIKGWQRPQKKK